MLRSRSTRVRSRGTSELLLLGIEQFLPSKPLLLFQKTGTVNRTQLPLETAVFDLEYEDLRPKRDTRYVLRALWLLHQNIIQGTSSKVVMQLFGGFDDVRHIVENTVD